MFWRLCTSPGNAEQVCNSTENIEVTIPIEETFSKEPTVLDELTQCRGSLNANLVEQQQVLKFSDADVNEEFPFVRQCSPLCDFADKGQTMIIFDWDDTIFPTTYLQSTQALDMTLNPFGQRKDVWNIQEIEKQMEKIISRTCALLTLASSVGNVIIVTLALRPWVTHMCKMFAPSVEEKINELGIKIVYAREFGTNEAVPEMMANNEINLAWVNYWSSKKAAAMSAHLDMFYSQYDGQSWKNVISIGDSDFERFGTEAATSGYLEKATSQKSLTAVEGAGVGLMGENDKCAWRHRTCQELDTGDKILKLRAKTIKMVQWPSPERLCAQLDVISQVIAELVGFDSGIDINLANVESQSDIRDLLEELGKPSLATQRRDLPTRLNSKGSM